MKILKICVIAFLFLFCFSSYVQAATPAANWIEIFNQENSSKIYIDKNSISKDGNGIICAWARTYPLGDLLKEIKKNYCPFNDLYYFDKHYCIPDSTSNNFVILQMIVYDSKGCVMEIDPDPYTGTYEPNSFDELIIKNIIELASKSTK